MIHYGLVLLLPPVLAHWRNGINMQRAFSFHRWLPLAPRAAGDTAELSVLVPRTLGNLILGYREDETKLRLR
jgi:hypothetical protein